MSKLRTGPIFFFILKNRSIAFTTPSSPPQPGTLPFTDMNLSMNCVGFVQNQTLLGVITTSLPRTRQMTLCKSGRISSLSPYKLPFATKSSEFEASPQIPPTPGHSQAVEGPSKSYKNHTLTGFELWGQESGKREPKESVLDLNIFFETSQPLQ